MSDPAPGPHLVCPACRDATTAHALQPHPLGVACPGCGRLHPIVDGVPIVLRDLDEWLASEAQSLLCRHDLPPQLATRFMTAAGGSVARDAGLLAAYTARTPGELDRFVAEILADAPGPVLDLGCGTGVVQDPSAVGVDLNWTVLQAFSGTRVLADALDPPFPAGCFGTVLALNVLDSCRDPEVLVQQAAALVRPGGTLVLTTPFAWTDGNTPPHLQLTEHQLDALFQMLGLEPERGELTWVLPRGPRAESHYRVATYVSRVPE